MQPSSRLSFDQYPERHPGGVFQLLGADEGWLAPIAILDMVGGFGEEFWEGPVTEPHLVMRLSGAPVECCWGAHAGRQSPARCATLLTPGTPYRLRSSGSVRYVQIYLATTLIDRVAEAMRPGATGTALPGDPVHLHDRELAASISAYASAAVLHPSTLEMEARSILIVARLLAAHRGAGARRRPSGGLAPWQIRRVCDHMSSRLDLNFTLESLAALVGFSATHFSRAFKTSLGVAPFQWLIQQRIESAKVLIQSKDSSLAEIAMAVGFSAQPQFQTAFRRVTGITPGAWRRQRAAERSRPVGPIGSHSPRRSV